LIADTESGETHLDGGQLIPSNCRDQTLGPHSSNQKPRVRLRLLL
jgi:hypothetical protein